MHAYQKGPIIGEGTYGSVICATQKATGRQVAIKKVRLSSNGRDGVNMSVLRELKALRSLAAPCVVELLDSFSTKSSLVLVFEFMEWSLEDVIRDKNQPLSEADIKSYMQMVLQALAHVHEHQAIHRDIKPDNLLISSSGQLKLADFGLARFLSSPADSPDDATGKLTPQVFGRWYRPPELLMGSSNYSSGVDMWAAGCVLAELLLRKPWFPGNCDMDQLDRIFKVLGVPTLETWPGYADLPHRIDFKPAPAQPLQQVFKQASPQALDLLQRLMTFNPEQRMSAAEALAHPYFSSQPAPTPPAQLPRPASTRLNRLGLSRVPAVIPDMLMPHRLLQQQQQGFATAGVAAAGWADAGETGEALMLQHPQQQDAVQAAAAGMSSLGARAGAGQVQAGASGTSRLLAFSDAPSFSGSFLGLGQGLLPAEQPQQCLQHQQGVQQLAGQPEQQRHSVHFAPDVPDLEAAEQEVPWKGRLSFSGILDEPTPPANNASNPASAEGAAGAAAAPPPAGDENLIPAGQLPAAGQQLQQQGYQRPSPVSAGNQQQQQQQKGATGGGQHAGGSSLRPPLHPNATPVHLRTAQQGAGAGADAGGGNGRQRRNVTDLSAALTSAAGGGAPSGATGAAVLLNPLAPWLRGMPRMGQMQGQPGLLDSLGQHGSAGTGGFAPAHAGTPAGAAAHNQTAAEDSIAGADADAACPMSLGTTARKRTRTAFESGSEQQQQQQQQGGQDVSDVSMLMSNDRRVVRSRRSSINSGCCSMETDTADGAAGAALHQHAHQQHGQYPAAGASAQMGQLGADDRSMSVTSENMQSAMNGAHALQQQQQREHQLHLQQQRELQYAADMPPPHAVQPRAAAAAGGHAHPPRRCSAATTGEAPEAAASAPQGGSNSGNKAALPGSGGSTCPMSLDHRATTVQRQPPADLQHQHQQAPGSDVHQQQQQQQQPTNSAAQQQGIEGINSGDLVTGGRPPADELRSMDPAELAELAKFWRPRLDSAERRYLRCRTMQLGEALLQASQPDDADDGPEYHHFPGMDSSPSGGRGLFDTPAKGCTPGLLADQQQQPAQQQYTQHAHQQHWGAPQQGSQQQQQVAGSTEGGVAAGSLGRFSGAAGQAVGVDAGAAGRMGGVAAFEDPHAAGFPGGVEVGQQQVDGLDAAAAGVAANAATLTAA